MTRFRLGTVLGFPLDVQLSWVPVFGFVTWTLATRFFPRIDGGRSEVIYWAIAGFASVLLFGSLLGHELGHAVIARWRGLPVFRISFFILGGMVEVDVERGSAIDELLMALAGPFVSLLLGLAFLAVWVGVRLAPFTVAGMAFAPYLGSLALYLACCNLLMAGFNLLPAFPLDGGRVLRAALWRLGNDRTRATRWASGLGIGGGVLGVFLGLAVSVRGDLLTGVWLLAVGAFLAFTAQSALGDADALPCASSALDG